jgi:heavy metal translocating P-type ATPase
MFTRLGLAIFCTMNVMAFTMALWSGDVYAADDSTLARALHGIFRYLSMLFAIPVFYSLGLPLLENALDSLKRGIANIDALLIAGVGASFAVSAFSVFADDGPIYFEVGCAVLVLVTLGRWLEASGKARASQSLEALEKLLPETVCAVIEGSEVNVPLRDIGFGAKLHVRAGDRIPCDGVLLEQSAHVDEQLLTGESAVQTKERGEIVHAGTLNLDGDLFMRVRNLPGDGALARLVRLVKEAQQTKGRFEQTADWLARWFLPVVAIVAGGAAIYHGMTQDSGAGILVGLSVVLIACPCALGIATPLALWTALGQAARRQVLFHGGDVLERLARVQHVCFDKTGTLTTGTPIVAREMIGANEDCALCYERAAALASASRHVHARAIEAFVPSSTSGAGVGNVQTLPGRGLRTDDGIVLGSERWMRELGMIMPDDLRPSAAGNAIVCLAWDGRVRCVFVLAEEWRPEASDVLNELSDAGLGVTILTGDAHLQPVPWDAKSGLLPEDKLHYLGELRRAGKVVAMVGDGINDGPALAASDVGIALGCGADVARDAAGVCLLDNDLRKIPWAISMSKKTVRVMRQNLFWAFVYNVAGIGLAAMGKLNPVLAALAMTLSSVFVLLNSLRLRDAAVDPLLAVDPQPMSRPEREAVA